MTSERRQELLNAISENDGYLPSWDEIRLRGHELRSLLELDARVEKALALIDDPEMCATDVCDGVNQILRGAQ